MWVGGCESVRMMRKKRDSRWLRAADVAVQERAAGAVRPIACVSPATCDSLGLCHRHVWLADPGYASTDLHWVSNGCIRVLR